MSPLPKPPGSETSEDDESQLSRGIQEAIDGGKEPSWGGPVAVDPPLFGSYHILFPVTFGDGVRWLLKVPTNGTRHHFDDAAARALSCEALTMRLPSRQTTIPVSDVFAFDAALDNELGCLFILMSFVDGQFLYDCWFDRCVPDDIVRRRRHRALQDVAAAMVELEKFSFDRAGDAEEAVIYVEDGPFEDPASFYVSSLDRRPEAPTHSGEGEQKLLRMLLGWIQQPRDGENSFVLAHPDLDIQNIIVSEEGELRALIDWDGVAAVTFSPGNQRYPSWLSWGWDPAMYSYDAAMEEGKEPEGLWEDSPETLRSLREKYARIIDSSLGHATRWTRISLLSENLLIAADDPLCTTAILDKVLNEISRAVGQGAYKATQSTGGTSPDDAEPDDFHIYDVACALADGELDPGPTDKL
ncbi:MAG: hypothetical protein M1833_001080 [Piccolia ochrophora]|nr:MAG: hypothetical protein M1833_001080 [Piccolia ochrophora]